MQDPLLSLQQFNHLLSKEAKPIIPCRQLGKTGIQVSIFGLGGQGALESHGDEDNCVKIIRRAIELGVTYFDTSPIYESSEDYYGAALGKDRKNIFLATKTDDRTRDGSLRLLEKSLKRLKTDYIDLWQIHHLEDMDDAAAATKKGGALDALKEMKDQGVVKFLGITGHDHPDALLYALLKHDFDTVLCPANACERNVKPSFLDTVILYANKKEMGVIGMKVFSQGHILGGDVTAEEALIYAMSQKVSTVIAGCDSIEQLENCVGIARKFVPINETLQRAIERKTAPRADHGCFYRREFGGYGSQEDLTTVNIDT
jgi:aryl-alcohol dehydrogenase-like predicted oxidoreductase